MELQIGIILFVIFVSDRSASSSGCPHFFADSGWSNPERLYYSVHEGSSLSPPEDRYSLASGTPASVNGSGFNGNDVSCTHGSSPLARCVDVGAALSGVGRCDVERVDSLSTEEFVRTYKDKRPVIIRNATDNCAFRDQCTRQRLLDDFGGLMVVLSTANAHSYDKTRVTLRHYIENMMRPQDLAADGASTFYHFGDHDPDDWDDLLTQYVQPPYPGIENAALSWGLGGHGTGVPFHTHGAVFAEVLHGRKRWFLYPPKAGFKPNYDPNQTTVRWLLEVYPHLTEEHRPIECVCEAGEIIYFPSNWWHATLNIGQSVFISAFL